MLAEIRSEITLISKFTPREGQERTLFESLSAVAAAGRLEEGNRLYVMHRSREINDGTIFLYVIWANQAAWDFHTQTKPFKDFVSIADELLAEPFEYSIWSEVSR